MPQQSWPLPPSDANGLHDSGSVRRAREKAGVGLTYFPYESGDQSTITSSPNTPGVGRSMSQASVQWQHESQRNTAQDILQHPLMNQAHPEPLPSYGNPQQNYRFPAVPPPATTTNSARRSREQPPPSSRRLGPAYYAPAQYSPIVEEGTDPSVRSRSVYSRASSGPYTAHQSSSRLNLTDDNDSTSVAGIRHDPTPASPIQSEYHGVRQAGWRREAEPATTTLTTGPGEHMRLDTERSHGPPQSRYPGRQATMEALSAAVASGMSTNDNHSNRPGPTRINTGGIRMPFEDPSPPHSPQSHMTSDGLELPHRTNMNGSARSASPLLVSPLRSETHLASANPGMSERIPSERRPAMLDMNAVHDMQQRGSTTSLADLIKRATKLASNLDRGKTASRLGMLDMFNADDKPNKHRDPNARRGSGISDMLSAFPAVGTPNLSQMQTKSEWPDEGVKMQRQPSSERHKKRRKCCGMSLPAFCVLMVLLIILVAAAVLVPLFLIVFPREHSNATVSAVDKCQDSFICHNGGESVLVGNSCSCVCTGGHTGLHCGIAPTTDCVSSSVPGVSSTDASMGNQISRLLRDCRSNYSIPIDSRLLLGLFSMQELSCQQENSLVAFDTATQTKFRKERRFYPLKAVEEKLKVPAPAPTVAPRMNLHDANMLIRRDSTSSVAQTSNGIVFQQSSSTADVGTTTVQSPPATTATATSSTAPDSVSGAPSSTASSSSSFLAVPERTLDFARIVVLYVLEQSTQLSVAINAQQILKNEFLGGDTKSTVEVGFGSLDLRADLAHLRILWGNGTVVGA